MEKLGGFQHVLDVLSVQIFEVLEYEASVCFNAPHRRDLRSRDVARRF